MKKNILLKIKYDGKDFHGWQKQPDVRTVQGEIEHVLTFIAGKKIEISGTSRTDSGVHALGQCASFVWDSNIPTDRLPVVMNRRFGAGGLGRSGAPGDIQILSAEEVPMSFNARFSCRGKTYKYIIDGSGDIFRRNYCWQMPKKLDVEAMKRAGSYVVGTHDFKCFETAGGTPRETTVRTVSRVQVTETVPGTENSTGRIEIEVTGDGFLYNMVRIIVGTLVEAGLGQRTPESVAEVIESRNRANAGVTAPPQGLYLKEIYFEGDSRIEG